MNFVACCIINNEIRVFFYQSSLSGCDLFMINDYVPVIFMKI